MNLKSEKCINEEEQVPAKDWSELEVIYKKILAILKVKPVPASSKDPLEPDF